MRVADIIGLNAMEIAEKYSLSQIHDRVVFVESQEIWGTLGGDIQYAIKDKEKVIDELTDLICRYCIAVEYDKKM